MAIAADGKITLNRERLKGLRRTLGISQEQLAFQCAEQGLCVSVASIKRAETSKNILYRTARDIARFYQLTVEELIAEPSHADISASMPGFAVNRQIVVLRCCWLSGGGHISIERLIHDIAELIEQYGARCIQNKAGDHWFAFGSEGVRGTEILRAGYFALKIQQRASEQDLPSPSCILVGVTACSDEEEAALINQTHPLMQNSLAVLAQQIAPGTIVVDGLLRPHAEHHFIAQPVTQTLVPELWEISPKPSEWQPSLSMVGRRVELMQFRAIMDSTTSFACAHAICLSGVAGIGKSRLLNEFNNLATAEGMEVHLCSMLDFGDHQTHQLIPQLACALLGLPKDVSEQENCLALQAEQLGISRQLPILHTMLGWPLTAEDNRLLASMSHSALTEQQIELAVTLLTQRASQQPLLIAIEDVHWADEPSKQFLSGLLQNVTNLPVIFVLTYRPEAAVQSVLQHGNASLATTTINLSPLDATDAQALAEQFSEITPVYRQRCIEKSQGNPLFLEYMLLDSGDKKNDQLPYSLQSLVLSRLEKLEVKDRDAAIAATVIGQRFTLEGLHNVLNQSDYDPQALIDGFLICRRGDHYQFNHALIRDGIYQSIIARNRQQLHQRCANFFLNQDLPLATKHLHWARSDKIADHLIPAITATAEKYQYETALELIEIGRQVDYIEVNTISLLLWQAEILAKLGNFSRSVDVAVEAEQISSKPEHKIQSLLLQANGLNTLDDFSSALRAIDAAENIAAEERLLAQLAKIYHLKGNFHFPRGDVETCINYHEKSLTFAKKIADPELEASALGGLGDAAYAQGKMYSAYDYLRRCLQCCQAHGLQHIEAPNLFMLGTVRIYQNQFQQALDDTLRAIQLAQRVGHKRAEIVARLTVGWIYLDALRLTEAAEHIEAGLALAHEIGAQRFVPFLEESQARLAFYRRDYAQAQTIIADALNKVETLRAESFIGPWLLGTQAIMADDVAFGERRIARGQQLLEQGCIGHNYFRFHVAAMEFGIRHQRLDIITRHQQSLAQFTKIEATPWSDFYINRAGLIADVIGGGAVDDERRQRLLNQGQESGLITALAALEDVSLDEA